MVVKQLRALQSSDDDGTTVVEYSLLAALVVGGLITAVGVLRDDVKAMFNTLMAAI